MSSIKSTRNRKRTIKDLKKQTAQPELTPDVVDPEQTEYRRVDMATLPYASGIRWVCKNRCHRWGYRIKQGEAQEVLGITLSEHIFQPGRGWCESYRWDSRKEGAEALFALLGSLTSFDFYGSTPTAEPEPMLMEEREHREDVPFYGRRHPDQANFRADVALNCGARCVYTNASDIRCDAAHLVPHARKGEASFKNGLLLRSDLHTLFDERLCAIDPATLQIWFVSELLESDADLMRIIGVKMRPTMKLINVTNLVERWEDFNGKA